MRKLDFIFNSIAALAFLAATGTAGANQITTPVQSTEHAQSIPAAGAPAVQADFDVTKAYPTDLVIGYPTAPVTIIEYASLTCPHCAHFHEQVYPELKKTYIDTGKVKFVYRDFPLDQSAFRSSVAVSCLPVGERPKAIALLFQTQDRWPTASFDEGVGQLFHDQVDPTIDLAKLKECVMKPEQQQLVAKPALDIRQAQMIQGTPAIFLNGKAFEGERTSETLSKAIEDVLKTVK